MIAAIIVVTGAENMNRFEWSASIAFTTNVTLGLSDNTNSGRTNRSAAGGAGAEPSMDCMKTVGLFAVALTKVILDQLLRLRRLM